MGCIPSSSWSQRTTGFSLLVFLARTEAAKSVCQPMEQVAHSQAANVTQASIEVLYCQGTKELMQQKNWLWKEAWQ